MLELSKYIGTVRPLAEEVDDKLEKLYLLITRCEERREADRAEIDRLAHEVRASNQALSKDIGELTKLVRGLVEEGRGVLRMRETCAEVDREAVYQEARKVGYDKRTALKELSKARVIRDQGGKHTCVSRYGDKLKRVVVVYR